MKTLCNDKQWLSPRPSQCNSVLRVPAALIFLLLVGTNMPTAQAQVANSSETSAWKITGSAPDVNDSSQADSQEQHEAENAINQNAEELTSDLASDDVQGVELNEQELTPQANGEETQNQELSNSNPDGDESITADDLSQEEATDASEPTVATTIKSTPVISIEPELRQSLARQFELIKTIQENEDAFSENLGEAYLGYGKLLTQAGRLVEAKEMYANALHLTKINNGVYSMEQRPVLRALFEMHEAQNNIDEMEQSAKQIIWLEKKHPKERDVYSYDLMLKLGNRYIDEFLYKPNISEMSLYNLNKARKYLTYTVSRYGDRPLNEIIMPYGELALIHYFKSKIVNELQRPFNSNNQPRQYADLDRGDTPPSRESMMATAEGYLNQYLEKAIEIDDTEHQVRALRDMGDLHLLFGRSQSAAIHYNSAWLKAQELNAEHVLVKSFDQPAELPNFSYSLPRTKDLPVAKQVVKVPLQVKITQVGKVKQVFTKHKESAVPELYFRARRSVRRMTFRPPIEQGRMIATDSHLQHVKVYIRRKRT